MKFIASALLVLILTLSIKAHAEDYYWVGGTGAWSDLNSWLTSTGEIPNEVPDPSDNVIFNENSFDSPFDTVYILTGNPTCHNLSIYNLQDTVILHGGTTTSMFSVYGSWTMHGKVKNNYKGKINFLSGEPGNTITCSGSPFSGDIWFEGTGEWILQDTLFVFESRNWKSSFGWTNDENLNFPAIYHFSGKLKTNEQTIVSRGFITTGNTQREFNFENSHAYIFGKWELAATNLFFNAANTYIYISGSMSNFSGSGEDIYYHDIEIGEPKGTIINTDIRTHMRKVKFLGGGSVSGELEPGQLGMFTIDTLIMTGGSGTNSKYNNTIEAHYSEIHYTLFREIAGNYYGDHGIFHRIDDSASNGTATIAGLNNEVDTVLFVNNRKAEIMGGFTIHNLAYFNDEGVLDSYDDAEHHASHVIINGDGWILGKNSIDLLTLGSGNWYQFQADQLSHPGSLPTQTHIQTIGEIELSGSCDKGLTFLTSDQKESMAFIEYLGNDFQSEYLAVKDIRNIGSEMQLEKSIDLGENEGFAFNLNHEPRTLYWVGGEGNWSDMEHWSQEAGGSGGECPPTPLDDVYFNMESGFVDSNQVIHVDIKYACANDFIWEEVDKLPTIASDLQSLRIWGSFVTNPHMQFLVGGNIYFESENDEDYESIIIDWTQEDDSLLFVPRHTFHNQVHFWGQGGKWRLDSKFEAYNDTTFLSIGELLLEDDTMSVRTFIATDTLHKGMYMLGNTLITLHYGGDSWYFNAYKYFKDDPGNSKTWWDAGRSIIRVVANHCNIRTTGDPHAYHNIEFGDTTELVNSGSTIPNLAGAGSALTSENYASYNLVDFYVDDGSLTGWGYIDTLSWKKVTLSNDLTVSAEACYMRNEYFINYLFAESGQNMLMMSGGRIDSAYFYNPGKLFGYHDIGFLEAHEDMILSYNNVIDTALLMGNTNLIGKNVFSQLVLFPNNKYIFQHATENQQDATTITNDWIVVGQCDAPIRLESDSAGTEAKINYLSENPSNTVFTADFASMKDIRLMGDDIHIATNSVDLGNNTNWEFIESDDKAFYWISGEGRWGDWSHWSYESGGDPIGDKCTPRENNTVIFDDNSFSTFNDTIYVDVLNAYCDNMYWIFTPGDFKPTFLGSDSSDLHIYGSMLLSDSMDYQFRGLIYFDEIDDIPDEDTITTKHHALRNSIRMQGIKDIIVLGDDLKLLDNYAMYSKNIILEHGEFRMEGYLLEADRFLSVYENPRTLNIENSSVYVKDPGHRVWWLEGNNLDFQAQGSQIICESNESTIVTENGGFFEYHNIQMNSGLDSLVNRDNLCKYNLVEINGISSLVAGEYIADTVWIRGRNGALFGKSNTHVVIIDSLYGAVNDTHQINRCFVNKFGLFSGKNSFDYCILQNGGVMRGTNEFDTLIMLPGNGNWQSQGNWYYFETNQTQTVFDSLYLRGNQCSNITIVSLDAPGLAWLKKDNGNFDISCDYLNILSVGAESENLTFYAGENSTALPIPSNPPPGWIFENAQGYIYGFDDEIQRFCEGESYTIKADNFNGDPNTQYFWNESSNPGQPYLEVTESGTNTLYVQYNPGCYVEDSVVVETDEPPQAVLDPGPFCEGEEIKVEVTPSEEKCTYLWWNGDSTSSVIASQEYSGLIFVMVTDTSTGCSTSLDREVVVKPTPDPMAYLGDETWIKFEEYINLDAGPGESWTWTTEPSVPTNIPQEREINISGYGDPNPVEYFVLVESDGCFGEGSKIIGMYPPGKLGVPSAFSPNGDGQNDELKVLGSGFNKMDFRIYNRYGELVFETTDPNIGWDGNVNNTSQDIEVFTYYLHVVYEDKTEAEQKGNITLIR